MRSAALEALRQLLAVNPHDTDIKTVVEAVASVDDDRTCRIAANSVGVLQCFLVYFVQILGHDLEAIVRIADAHRRSTNTERGATTPPEQKLGLDEHKATADEFDVGDDEERRRAETHQMFDAFYSSIKSIEAQLETEERDRADRDEDDDPKQQSTVDPTTNANADEFLHGERLAQLRLDNSDDDDDEVDEVRVHGLDDDDEDDGSYTVNAAVPPAAVNGDTEHDESAKNNATVVTKVNGKDESPPITTTPAAAAPTIVNGGGETKQQQQRQQKKKKNKHK